MTFSFLLLWPVLCICCTENNLHPNALAVDHYWSLWMFLGHELCSHFWTTTCGWHHVQLLITFFSEDCTLDKSLFKTKTCFFLHWVRRWGGWGGIKQVNLVESGFPFILRLSSISGDSSLHAQECWWSRSQMSSRISTVRRWATWDEISLCVKPMHGAMAHRATLGSV